MLQPSSSRYRDSGSGSRCGCWRGPGGGQEKAGEGLQGAGVLQGGESWRGDAVDGAGGGRGGEVLRASAGGKGQGRATRPAGLREQEDWAEW